MESDVCQFVSNVSIVLPKRKAASITIILSLLFIGYKTRIK